MAIENAMNELSLNESGEEEEQLVNRCIFETTLGEAVIEVCYKTFNTRYFLAVHQGFGDTGVGRIMVNKPPIDDGSAKANFTIVVLLDCDGFQEAANQIALELGIDKPLHLYLCLSDFKSETIKNFIQILLQHVGS